MVPSRTVVKLKQAETIALADWLRGTTIQPGDTYKSLAKHASAALKLEKINANHIDGLMKALGIELPKPATGPEERLMSLEAKLNLLIQEQLRFCKEYGITPSAELMAIVEY